MPPIKYGNSTEGSPVLKNKRQGTIAATNAKARKIAVLFADPEIDIDVALGRMLTKPPKVLVLKAGFAVRMTRTLRAAQGDCQLEAPYPHTNHSHTALTNVLVTAKGSPTFRYFQKPTPPAGLNGKRTQTGACDQHIRKHEEANA